ncbi:hypothetical protein ACFPYJ_14610 [Paenibacillus solisilvae]|uniref:DUF4352 domain-containing protein n=1 Tax=Paenibacillus solisilvae TaxID=2486751 RepID=A0ABW0VZQ9_9BACL
MKKKVILGLVAVLGIAGIASAVMANEGFTKKEPQKSIKIVPIHHKETIGDLVYEIQLSKNQFDLDNEIEVYAKVTNIGKETMTYVSGSSSCPNHVVIDIVHQESNTSLAIKQGEACTSDLGTSILAPAQTVEDKWIFIPKQWINSKLEPALTGTYDVEVALPPESIEFTEDQPEAKNQRASTKTSIILTGKTT